MLRLTIVYLILSMMLSHSNAQSIKILYNEDYATIQFVKRLLDPNPTKEKELYFKLKGLDFTTLHFLDSLKIDYLSYTLRYHDYPIGQKMNLSFNRLMEKYIIDQTPQISYRQFAEGIIPEEYIKQYERLLYLFKPIYLEIVGKPFAFQIELGLRLIQSRKEEFLVDSLLRKISKFYGVKMQDYKVMIYPVLDNHITYGTSFLNMAEITTAVNNFDARQILITAIHEINHLFYADMSNVLKRRIDYLVNDSKLRTSRYSNWLIDEVLATAIGNGWAYKEMFNTPDNGLWYFRNEYVNNGSKQIVNLVSQYLNDEKVIDIKFIDTYLDRMRIPVSNWMKDWEFLLMYREVRAPSYEYFELVDRYFPSVYYRRYLINNNIYDMQSSTTKLFIFSDNLEEDKEMITKQLGIPMDSLGDFSKPFVKVIPWIDKAVFIFMYGDKDYITKKFQEQSKWYQYQLKGKKRRK